ncbi:PAS domain-containing protein [Nostocoides sp. F2B08]|nr:PAS domain-containing protein [Tetrasphaera sp. F2B08]
MAELLPDGFIALTAEGTVESFNRRAVEICGVEPAVLRGGDVRQVLPLQDVHGQDWWEISEPSRRLPTTTGHREKALMLRSGRMVLLTARYLRDPEGRLFGILLALRDAAERERADSAVAELITTVAHELRSPVAGITGFTASLLQHWDRFDDGDKRVMLETIEHDAQRVTRLITELLDVARIDARTLQVRPQPLDLEALLRTHVARCVVTGEPESRFELRVAEDLPQLWADPDRLEQIVANLVDNALRHGAGLVRIEVDRSSLDDGTPAVSIAVSDQGDGIAEANRELVFSRYWQGGAKAGTGLGLFLVRGIVAAHGGSVRVTDAPGGGARLELLLPVRSDTG